MVPGVIALLAIYVRATCPESPYWVRRRRSQAAHRRTLSRGGRVSDDDNAWFGKAKSVGIRQGSCPTCCPLHCDAVRACCSTCIFGTVGSWMPLYLATEKHWSTAEYGLSTCSGHLGLSRPLRRGLARRQDRPQARLRGDAARRRHLHDAVGLHDTHVLLWVFGLAWSFGFLGFWGPSTTLTAEVFPTGFAAPPTAWCGRSPISSASCCFPFVTVALQQHTGSFALSFPLHPVLMVAMAIGVTLMVPEHSGKELNEIIV